MEWFCGAKFEVADSSHGQIARSGDPALSMMTTPRDQTFGQEDWSNCEILIQRMVLFVVFWYVLASFLPTKLL